MPPKKQPQRKANNEGKNAAKNRTKFSAFSKAQFQKFFEPKRSGPINAGQIGDDGMDTGKITPMKVNANLLHF